MIKVSIIIPLRNEEKFIIKCLDSILAQDYPKENLEVLVVDGISQDKTKEIVEKYAKEYGFIRILDNPKKYTPSGLNIGIKAAKGEIIIRLDAHADYEKDYISKCVKYLEEKGVDNVGGILKTLPAENTLMARSIALSLSSIFGAGNSAFRTGVSEPTFVDTVFGGCYKKSIFEKIGYYNEDLIRSQDMELNMRLKKAGGKILLMPDIVAYYYPKTKIQDFFRHNIQDGFWSVYAMKFAKMPFGLRHYVPLFFVCALALSFLLGFFISPFKNLFYFIIVLYAAFSLFFSFHIAQKERKYNLMFVLPIVFVVRHFGYGIGSLWGIIRLLENK